MDTLSTLLVWGNRTKGEYCGDFISSLLLARASCWKKTAKLSVIWNNFSSCDVFHDDVIKWKYFPRYWPFVRGIHRGIHRTKASDAELWCFLWSAPKRLSKQLRGWWFGTPSRPSWRHIMLCRGTGSPSVLQNQVQAGCRYTRLQVESLSISPYFLQAVLDEFNLFDDGCVLPTPDDADQQWDGEQRHRNYTYSHTQGVDCSWKFKYCHGIFRQ